MPLPVLFTKKARTLSSGTEIGEMTTPEGQKLPLDQLQSERLDSKTLLLKPIQQHRMA